MEHDINTYNQILNLVVEARPLVRKMIHGKQVLDPTLDNLEEVEYILGNIKALCVDGIVSQFETGDE